MHSEYVEQRYGGYYVAGVRVSLDSVVYSFNRGESPETIQENFPVLKLSQIYGAIAFYLDHKAEIDKYLEDTEREFEGSAIPLEQDNPALWAKIQRPRHNSLRARRVSHTLEHSFPGRQRSQFRNCQGRAAARTRCRFRIGAGGGTGRCRRS